MKTSGLDSYARYTPESKPGRDLRRDRLEARLDRLRAINAAPTEQPRLSIPQKR